MLSSWITACRVSVPCYAKVGKLEWSKLAIFVLIQCIQELSYLETHSQMTHWTSLWFSFVQTQELTCFFIDPSFLILCGCVSATVIVHILVPTCGCGQSRPDLVGGGLTGWERTTASPGLFWGLIPALFLTCWGQFSLIFLRQGCVAYSSSCQSWLHAYWISSWMEASQVPHACAHLSHWDLQMVFLNPSSSAWGTVRPDKPKHSSLGQKKVHCRATQGEWVACAPTKPQTPGSVSARQF